MQGDQETINFNRSRIYEKLEYIPIPEDYNSPLDWRVQLQIAATNGRHYTDRIGKLDSYPIYELPLKKAKGHQLMLDIGSGWGRWLIAGAYKGYIPIGLDLRLEFCQTSRKVLKDLNLSGYLVVADLENLPFQDSTFDMIWSYSVIQHTHKKRLLNCLQHINRILKVEGFTKLEFPNKNGIRNRILHARNSEKHKDDYNTWHIRYYTIREYKKIIGKYLDKIKVTNHSFIGIGVLKEDLKYVSLKNKIFTAFSLAMSQLTRIIVPLKNLSDSIYIYAVKKGEDEKQSTSAIEQFFHLHKLDPTNNLNIISLLRCPISKNKLFLSKDGRKLISKEIGKYFPIVDQIPILIASEAIPISSVNDFSK